MICHISHAMPDAIRQRTRAEQETEDATINLCTRVLRDCDELSMYAQWIWARICNFGEEKKIFYDTKYSDYIGKQKQGKTRLR